MNNAQVAMIAGAVVLSSAIIGFAISRSSQRPTPEDRAQQTSDFFQAVAEKVPAVTETVKIEMARFTITSFERALALYARDHDGQLPDTLDALAGDPKKYVELVWPDPWGRDYRYAVTSEAGSARAFDLYSAGPDGRDNTADDIRTAPVQ